jgi:hypothetical protein
MSDYLANLISRTLNPAAIEPRLPSRFEPAPAQNGWQPIVLAEVGNTTTPVVAGARLSTRYALAQGPGALPAIPPALHSEELPPTTAPEQPRAARATPDNLLPVGYQLLSQPDLIPAEPIGGQTVAHTHSPQVVDMLSPRSASSDEPAAQVIQLSRGHPTGLSVTSPKEGASALEAAPQILTADREGRFEPPTEYVREAGTPERVVLMPTVVVGQKQLDSAADESASPGQPQLASRAPAIRLLTREPALDLAGATEPAATDASLPSPVPRERAGSIRWTAEPAFGHLVAPGSQEVAHGIPAETVPRTSPAGAPRAISAPEPEPTTIKEPAAQVIESLRDRTLGLSVTSPKGGAGAFEATPQSAEGAKQLKRPAEHPQSAGTPEGVVLMPTVVVGQKQLDSPADESASPGQPQPANRAPVLRLLTREPALDLAGATEPAATDASLPSPVPGERTGSIRWTAEPAFGHLGAPGSPGVVHSLSVEASPKASPTGAPAATNAPIPEPTIQITIGRIEVRASVPAAPVPHQRQEPAKSNLDEYLRQRNGGGS